jgi:haloalkane dehalogenase
MKPEILFTSPCGPYPKLPPDKDPIDYFYYKNTFKQKMFQLRSFQSWHSLHFLAQNIPVASVVMENPTMQVFQQEIKSGNYKIVAIGFTFILTKKVLEMVEWLKAYQPEIEIILGGYGTAIFKESIEESDRLKNLVDHICYGEGLGFIRAIIASKWNISGDYALKQNLLPIKNSFFRTHIELFKQLVLVGGLGCVNGCSFCATSSQFNRKHIPLFTGKALYDSLLTQSERYPEVQSAIIYEEDFLLNRPQVLEFIKHFESGVLSKRPFLLTVFASVKSISQYTVEELIACGIGTIFIGVESLDDEVLLKEGFAKRKGGVIALFEQLHDHGINTLGSLIIGLDSQTAAIAKSDSEKFIEMNPTFYQVIPLHAVPGTKQWEVMKASGRISTGFTLELDGMADYNFNPENLSHAEVSELVLSTYYGLVYEGGPWPFRMFENLLKGYLNLKDNPNPVLSNRAGHYRKMISPVFVLAFVSRYFFFGKQFKRKWKKSMKQFMKAFPGYFMLSVLLSPVIAVVLLLIYGYGNVKYWLSPGGDQPDFWRGEYEGVGLEKK